MKRIELLCSLERNVVVLVIAHGRVGISRGLVVALARGRAALCIAGWALLGCAAFPSASSSACSAFGQELDVFADDAKLGAFLPGLLVFPCVELEAAFDEDAAALGEVVGCDFSLTVPEGDVDKSGFFLPVGVFGGSGDIAVDGKPDVGDGCAFGCVSDFGVCGQIPHEEDFVEIRHKNDVVYGVNQKPFTCAKGSSFLPLYRSFMVLMQPKF